MTDQQFTTLSAFEETFSIIRAKRSVRNPGYKNLESIRNVVTSIKGKNFHYNITCSRCIGNLLNDAADLYFKEKARRQVKVELSAEETDMITNVEIKTEKI